jgi:putative inorganic carbon (HCO3(-)) transporter
VVLLGALALGLVRSSDPLRGVVTVGHTLAGVTLFFAIQEWATTRDRLWQAVEATVLAGLLFAFAAPLVSSSPGDKLVDLPQLYTHVKSVVADPSNPNNVAGLLAPMIPLAIALATSQRAVGRAIGSFSLVPLVLVTALLQSRGALLGLAVGLITFASLRWKWALPLIPVTLLAGLFVNSAIGDPRAVVSAVEKTTTSPTLKLALREDIWLQAFAALERAPVLGIGPGAFEVEHGGEGGSGSERIPLHAHSLPLQVALDTGLVGLAAFAGIVGYAIFSALRAWSLRAERALAIGVIAALAAILTHGILDTIFWGAKPGLLLWMCLGVAVALGRMVPDASSPSVARGPSGGFERGPAGTNNSTIVFDLRRVNPAR